MLSRKEKPKEQWTFGEWEGWITEAEDMHRLALQQPKFLNIEIWRLEVERRRIEHEEMLKATGSRSRTEDKR
jgi:hypothetical protein